VCTRQPNRSVVFLLLVLVLSICAQEVAQAQTRWPPWQSYGEAERAARAKKKLKRPATPQQSQIDALNKKVEELRQAGKHAEATAAAQTALRLTERRYGPYHARTATALTTLAELLIAQKRFADAEPLLKRALAIREKSKSSTDAEIAEAVDNLAELYAKQGREADAAPLRKRSAALRGEKTKVAPTELAPAPKTVAQPHAYKRKEPRHAAKRNGDTPAAVAGDDTAGSSERFQPESMARAPDSTEPAGGAALAKPKDWDVVPVFFGTDRAEVPNPKRLSYNSDRGHRLQIGRALVTVPKIHEVPHIERPWAIRIPYFDITIYEETEDPNKHFTMQEIKKLPEVDFLRLVRARLAGSARFKDQAFVFVHGYNTSFDNAVYRTAQISYDLKFDGAAFVYSWPSGGGVASYTYDRETADASKPYMRQFLELVVKETGAKAVSIIAHSMGNQPLLDVLKDMKTSAPEGVVISQIILAAPDVDSDSFSQLAQSIKGMAKGVTLYAAANDRALLVSRNFWGHYRAGDVPAGGPLVLPGIDTIDVTAASMDAFAINHSEYAENNELLKDIGELLRTGLRPPDQRVLRPERVTTDKGAYWRYAAPPSP